MTTPAPGHQRVNEHNQPIGPDLGDWTAPAHPSAQRLAGGHVELVALDPTGHAAALFEALQPAPDSHWTYLPFGPFGAAGELEQVLHSLVDRPDWFVFCVLVNGTPLGFVAYLRIDERNGVAEIGSVVFSPALQRTTAATETIYLLINNLFATGYRRCEWKCDALHAGSRAAAERFGFLYEGAFAKATHYKGRSRDTAWYAIVDDRWPQLKAGFDHWLAPENFSDSGNQLMTLRHCLGT